MSLRRRLFTLLLISCVALAASVVGITRLLDVGTATREATAASVAQRAMLALAYRLDGGLEPSDPAIALVLEDLARTVEDGSVGVCFVDGHVGPMKTTFGPGRGPGSGPGPGHGHGHGGPPHGGPPPDWDGPPPDGPPPHDTTILPLDYDRVVASCRAATGEPDVARVAAPDDLLTVAAVRTRHGNGPVAFALTRVPRLAPQRASTLSVALLAIAGVTSAVLLLLTAQGAWVLRSSTASLQASVDALKRDLRAPISEPKALELAEVAEHLRTLAATLADAQERERALTHENEEQKRLAGLGRVVAGVAHEVRNPLAGMKLRLDSMALRPLDARSRVDVERCLREVGRLDRLVRALLLVSKKRAPEKAPFDAHAMVTERIALAQALAQATNVSLDCEGDATVHGEREGLSAALDNLLRNAVEASPADGRVVVVVTSEGDDTRIDVIDEGPGISVDRAPELFEPFFTTKGSGTGLGLVLARATVEAHGGTLSYERKDEHTVFSMTIPHG